MDFAIVGCSLDALDAEEILAMKLAHLYARKEGLVDEVVRGRAVTARAAGRFRL